MPTAKKKSSSKKAVSKKKVTAKKAVPKKKKVVAQKAAAQKKAPAKKVINKKTVAKKKATVTKAVNKKTVAKKKVTVTKAVVKKPVAITKKKGVSKKSSPKTTAKKKILPKAVHTRKKPAVKSKGTLATAVKSQTTHSTPVEGFATYKLRSDEEYMNDGQVEHFRDLLRAWKIELMQEVDRTVHHMQDEAANFPDPNDRATQESEFSLELRTRDRERKLIKKIDESFVLLDTGEYGYCESCGIEIGVRRLEARPTATQCIDCKTLDEIREKQRG